MTRTEEYRLKRAARDEEIRKNSRGGVIWYEAKIPHRFHICRVQTEGWAGLYLVQRCACGAARSPFISSSWMDRNSRRLAA